MICAVATTTVSGQTIIQNDLTAQQQTEVSPFYENGSFYIEGKAVVTKSSTIYNINPYNPATIEGLGENGQIRLLDEYGTIDIPLSQPLYKLSDGYADKIIFKNGAWGIERNVGV